MRFTTPRRAAIVATCALVGASAALMGQEPTAPPPQTSPPTAPGPQVAPPPAGGKTGADPTDFITRIEPSYEHKTLNDGTGLDIMTVRADLALRPNASIRLDFPLLSFDPTASATAAGYREGFGLGDIVSQISYKPYSNARMAVLTALRFDINTSSLPGLGQGGTTVAPVGAVAFLRGRWLVAPVVQYSVGSDLENTPFPGTRDASELSIRCVTVFQIGKPNITYLLFDPELIRDFEAEATQFTLNLEYGKVIGKGALLLLRPSVGLDDEGSGVDWGFKFAFRQMWPGKHIVN